MDTFSVKIANRVISVTGASEPCRERCLRYLVSAAEPVFTVNLSREDIERERTFVLRTDALENRPAHTIREDELEYLAICRKAADYFPDHSTVLFHGSVVSVDGAAYCFTAPSGTGKSTHTALWRKQFGERAVMVNDDKPLITADETGAFAHGTPWDGKHRLSNPISVPLKAICILERASENSIEQISFAEAYPILVQQTYRPRDPVILMKTLNILDRLNGAVSFYRLKCNMDPEAALVSYRGMQGKEDL